MIDKKRSLWFMEKSAIKHIHCSLQASREFIQLCQPLLDKLTLSFIRYVRINANGSLQVLSTRPEVIEWYFKYGLYQYGYNEGDLSLYQNGFVLSDSWEKSQQVIDYISKPLCQQFDIGSELVIYSKKSSYCDVLEVALSPNHQQANQFLMRHYQLIENFFHHIILASDLVGKSNQASFHLPKSTGPSHSPPTVVTEEAGVDIQKLAPRELQCLFWMKQGKTIPEIALILKLSSRTIEMYINNMRRKLGVYTFFQLGEMLGMYHWYFQPIFNEICQLQ